MTKHYVHVSSPVFAQIMMGGLEAFVVKHGNKKRHAIEMHASLYGRVEEAQRTQHWHIDMISVDTSAEMTGGYVAYRPESSSLKTAVAEALGFEALGTLHTHPYLSHEMTLQDVRTEGFGFSKDDLASYRDELSDRKPDASLRALHCVLTIRNKDDDKERQRTDKDGPIGENAFEFSLANCKCFLNVQVFLLDSNRQLVSEPTILKCEDLQEFRYLRRHFGRITVAEGRQRIIEHRP